MKGATTDPSLVLHLPLRELDGDSFMSRDAYGHLATVTGATWTPHGRIFDGTDDYITVPYHAILNLRVDFTIIMWVNPDAPVAADGFFISNGRDNADGYMIYIQGLSEGKGKIRFQTNQSAAKQNTYSEYVIQPSVWQQVGFVKKGTVATLYHNGIDVTAATDTHIDCASSSRDTFLGIFGYSLGAEWVGGIALTQIFNRAFTPLEIQHNYLATKDRYI